MCGTTHDETNDERKKHMSRYHSEHHYMRTNNVAGNDWSEGATLDRVVEWIISTRADDEYCYIVDLDDFYQSVCWYVGVNCQILEMTDHEDGTLAEREIVFGHNGEVLDWDAVVHYMGDELREELSAEMAPCSSQAFLEAYAARHMEVYGEEFVPYVGGAW